MILSRPILALLLAATATAAAQSIDVPPVPDGHVLDAANSLGDRRRAALTRELARIRDQHRIDVHAVHWDRELPADSDLAALAARLGKSWSREDAWVVVLQLPGEHGAIAGAHGGFGSGDDAARALAHGLARGRREWTPPARLAASALECAEEFIFLKNSTVTPPAKPALASVPPANVDDTRGGRIVRLAAACAIVLLLALAALFWSLRSRRTPRQAAPHHFPDTKWNRRFGAPWSGGSNLGARLPDSRP